MRIVSYNEVHTSCWSWLGHAFLLYCSSNDYKEIIPDVIHCPNKDVRARSDRLQLGTAHIQSFTQTYQVSVIASFSDEFLLHSSSWFSEVSFTLLILVLVTSFPYTPDGSVSEEFLLHSSSWF